MSWVNQDERTGLVVPAGRRRRAARGDRAADGGCARCARALGAAGRARVEQEFTLERLRERLRRSTRRRRCCRRGRPHAEARASTSRSSGAGLIASAPLWLVFAAAIKLEDGGPVFFAQERVGLGGRAVRALKFRSMRPDAEARTGAVQATEHDPRVTRIGRFMRATAMDELPQLWNILRGDMSFVGPRALRPGEIEAGARRRARARSRTCPGFATRITVRPGLTGIAQVYAPRDVPRRHKFRYDRLYVRTPSWWLDVRLILLSFWISVHGTWEARGRKY